MADMAHDDELDRELDKVMARRFGPPHAGAAHAESIEPSSGFATSVMERVRAEAGHRAALGPIAFPWRRALPGICMAVLALLVAVAMLIGAVVGVGRVVSQAAFAAAVQGSRAPLPGWADTVSHFHLGWLLVALAIAFVPVMISRSLVGRGHRL